MSKIPTYRQKPVELQAIQWTDDKSLGKILTWLKRNRIKTSCSDGHYITLLEHNANNTALLGDFIVKDNGKFRVVTEDTFRSGHEEKITLREMYTREHGPDIPESFYESSNINPDDVTFVAIP